MRALFSTFVAVLAAAVVVSVAAQASSPACISSGTSVAMVNVPSTTMCVILYNTNWGSLGEVTATPSAGQLTLSAKSGSVAHVEFYSDSGCTVYIESADCTVASAAAANTPAPSATTTKPPSSSSGGATSSPPTQAASGGITITVGSPSCKVSGSSVVLASSTATKCIVIYDSNWHTLLQATSVSLASGQASLPALTKGTAGNIEFYSDTKCTALINTATCKNLGTGATTAPPTNKPTTPGATTPPTKPAATSPPTTKPAATSPPGTNPPYVPGSRPPTNVRAMYVWMYGDCLFNNVAAGTTYSAQCGGTSDYITYQNNLISNLVDPWGKFPAYNRIYLEMDIANVINSPAIVRAFLVKAHAAGIAVEFLDGVASWVESTANAQAPMSECDALVAFNQGSTNPAEWIDGLNLDIEPHTLANWHLVTPGAPDNYNQVYEANLMAIFNHCMAVTRPTTMSVTWSVGDDYYLYVHGLWNPLLGSSPYVDYVTVMNYYSSENSFLNGGSQYGTPDIGGVSNIVDSLQGGIVTAVFAAESMPPPYAPAWMSFWAIGYNAMEATLAAAVADYSSNKYFAGTATHWYGTYFELKAGTA